MATQGVGAVVNAASRTGETARPSQEAACFHPQSYTHMLCLRKIG
jgi:hypothetical protein